MHVSKKGAGKKHLFDRHPLSRRMSGIIVVVTFHLARPSCATFFFTGIPALPFADVYASTFPFIFTFINAFIFNFINAFVFI